MAYDAAFPHLFPLTNGAAGHENKRQPMGAESAREGSLPRLNPEP
jgi:hypothetical protein